MQPLRQDASITRMQLDSQRLLNNSPSLINHLRSDLRRDGNSTLHRDIDEEIPVNQAEWKKEKEKYEQEIESLQQQLRHRTQTYLQSETSMKRKIETLEKQLEKRIDDSYHKRMTQIRSLHENIISGIMTIQGNTAKVLEDQEKDLMRAFRARLDDVTKELELQKIRKNDTNLDLQAEHRHVVAQWHSAKELAEIFDQKNQQLIAENKKLQEKLRTRDDDKQATMKQLILTRKDNNRLRIDITDLQKSKGDLESKLNSQKDQLEAFLGGQDDDDAVNDKKMEGDRSRLGECANRMYQRELKYREAVMKSKKLLEMERANSRMLKDSHSKLLTSRSELEVLLKQCLDDVKQHIKKRRQAAAEEHAAHTAVRSAVSGGGGSSLSGPPPAVAGAAASIPVSVHDFATADRERVLEMLLSQQRVVSLLYEKTFTSRPDKLLDEDGNTTHRNGAERAQTAEGVSRLKKTINLNDDDDHDDHFDEAEDSYAEENNPVKNGKRFVSSFSSPNLKQQSTHSNASTSNLQTRLVNAENTAGANHHLQTQNQDGIYEENRPSVFGSPS